MISPNLFSEIISSDNLFKSWCEFQKDKHNRFDVQFFWRHLEDNLFSLHSELKNKTYQHSDYTSFCITDPKSRHIHKACVRDRIVHHAIYRVLYPIFNPIFVDDSYSCRNKKGTHKAVKRLEKFSRIVSKNYTKPCWTLKCDIKKYFSSVNHQVLYDLIKRNLKDKQVLWLISEIISSFHSEIQRERERVKRGVPIGNLTSQLFANIYLNELDQFVKHRLKVKFYLRYCDDFVILENDLVELEKLIPEIKYFLYSKLKLELHPNKIIIRKLNQGIDFLGYVVLPHYRVLRTKTKRRMLKKANEGNMQSYLGLIKHCSSYGLRQKLLSKKF